MHTWPLLEISASLLFPRSNGTLLSSRKSLSPGPQEQTRLHVLNTVWEHQLPMAQAAELLGVSERHAWRLLAAYRKDGADALVHGNCGRRPCNAVSDAEAPAVVKAGQHHLRRSQPHPPDRTTAGTGRYQPAGPRYGAGSLSQGESLALLVKKDGQGDAGGAVYPASGNLASPAGRLASDIGRISEVAAFEEALPDSRTY